MSGSMSGRTDTSDEALLEGFLSGDAAMFEELVRRYERPLAGFLYRLAGSREQAEELFQETMLRAWRKADTFRGDASFKAWLYTIARNLCYNQFRRKQLPTRSLDQPWREGTDAPADSLPAGGPTPSDGLSAAEVQEVVRQAVHQLPEGQRDIFILHHYQNLGYQEIAAALDIPLGTVKSRMYHAVRALRPKLRQLREDLS